MLYFNIVAQLQEATIFYDIGIWRKILVQI